MICSTLECYSEAVAQTVRTGKPACIKCALKVVAQHGPESMKCLPFARFPWGKIQNAKPCPCCGVSISKYLIGLTGECPKCRKSLDEDFYMSLFMEPPRFAKSKVAIEGASPNPTIKYGEGYHD